MAPLEIGILLALLDSAMTRGDMEQTFGQGAIETADSLVERGLVHRSARGNYVVIDANREGATSALGSHAPVPRVRPLREDRTGRGYVEYFNGICDPPQTYELMLRDGLHGAREKERRVVEKIQPGDLLIDYVTQPYSEWVAVQRVVDWPFETDPRLHGHADLPFRIPADFIVALRPGRGFGRIEAADSAHANGGKAAQHRYSPRRIDPIAGRVMVRKLLEIARYEQPAAPVVPLGAEYEKLIW